MLRPTFSAMASAAEVYELRDPELPEDLKDPDADSEHVLSMLSSLGMM